MKKILGIKARSRRIMIRIFLRWFLYSAVLLVFYLMETNPIIRGFCPLLLIPLATAVAMYEGDLAAGIFAVFCGIMLDMANGVTVLGFSALWLLCACPIISLLSRFWVKVNVLSHLVINAAVTAIMATMDMLFLHWTWEGVQSGISFVNVILPGYGGAILFSIPVYMLVSLISKKMRPKEERRLNETSYNTDESDINEKTQFRD